jgi:hypothetical protein
MYRNDVEALAARHAALDAEVTDRTRQRDEAARLLAEASARAKLPILDNLRVASPCSMRWNDMTGDDRVRACAKCDKNVFNLSALTREEAEQLLIEKNGKLCVRYYQRSDGTILTADCAIGVRNRRRRRWVAAGLGALAAVGGAVGIYRATRSEPVREIAGSPAPLPVDHGAWIQGGPSGNAAQPVTSIPTHYDDVSKPR